MNLSVFYLILLLSILQLASCATEENIYREYKGRIKVEGKALNGKGGRVVMTTDSIVYLLRGGPNYWDANHYKKNVRVKGPLIIENYPNPNTEDSAIWIPHIPYNKIIERAKVKLIE